MGVTMVSWIVLQGAGAAAMDMVATMLPLVMMMLVMLAIVGIVSSLNSDSDMPSPSKILSVVGGAAGAHKIGLLIFLGIIGLIVWFFRPWFHAILYGLYATPELFAGIILALIVSGFIGLFTERTFPGAVGFSILLVLISLGVGGLYASDTLGDQTMGNAVERPALPEIDAEHPRILTRATANRYASNSLQTSKFRATGSDITMYNDTAYWSYALAPDGTRNWLLEKQNGTVLVNMETQSKDVQVIDQDMQVGQGMAVRDDYRWRLLKDGPYLVNYQEPFMIVDGGEQYMAVPYIRPEFHLRLAPFPTVYTTPTWGGVALIDSGGDIEYLSPSEAREHAVLSEQRLAPFDLVRHKVASTSYRNGIVNVLPVVGSHHEQIEVTPVPGAGNDQPFFVRTTEGMKYIVAVEPYGDTQGVREVWVVDARTEQYEVYQTGAGSTLLGPTRAADYVRQAARQTDWDRFSPAEPIPVVVDGTLYWELRVVPEDASGISYVAFVNAETSDVVNVEETSEVVAFLRGEDAGTVLTNGSDAGGAAGPRDGEPSIVVRKTNADGEVVETLYVYDNESVVIERDPGT